MKLALILSLVVLCTSATLAMGQNSPSSPPPTSCSYSFSNNKEYATCLTLPQLGCYLHWTYNSTGGTADIAFRATGITSDNWVAWALNPTSSGMSGAQSLVAFQDSTGEMRAYTSSVQSAAISTLDRSNLSFNVSDLAAESSGGQIIIYATAKLPEKRTTINHVWQVGPLSDGSPAMHALDAVHFSSYGTIDFSTGVAKSASAADSQIRNKNVHGVLNVVSWGVLMPIGVIIARYMKVFKSANPAWFYLHIGCQCTAYFLGVVGWATGLKLGSVSKGITYHSHRNIGITLFCLATLQVFALRLRPDKDSKYRIYWNLYHWSVGYSVIVLSIINIFKGLNILDPGKKWKMVYIAVIVSLGCIAVLLEASTWVIVLRRRKDGAQVQQKSTVLDSGLDVESQTR